MRRAVLCVDAFSIIVAGAGCVLAQLRLDDVAVVGGFDDVEFPVYKISKQVVPFDLSDGSKAVNHSDTPTVVRIQ